DDDLDGFYADEDCDDSDQTVFPGADEICDGLDNDCDGDIDEDGLTRFYPDADGDGYGDAGSDGEDDCGVEPNRATNNEDCNDTNSLVNPLADEVCDGVDNNCDGTVDEPEAIDAQTWFPDQDADGFGDPLEGLRTCDPESSWVLDDQDCDDLDPAVNPAAQEICNGLDDDCDGSIDMDAVDALSWYADSDSDSYGDPGDLLLSCTQPGGYVADSTDCDDAQGNTNPGASEGVADGVDSDCDGEEICYVDRDADTWGKDTVASSDLSCSGANLANRDGDCKDGDSDTFPGSSPNDSSTSCMTDVDGDDYGDANPKSGVTAGSDCDDDDASINTSAAEITGDSVDQDCDGGEICYVDSDGDNQGSTSTTVSTDSDCNDNGEADNANDCNDGDSSVYLGASETVGDEVDSDCDGGEICYMDADSDDYGSTTTVTSSDTDCADSGEATNDEDCDDGEVLANPGETEVCDDGIDNDCSGEFDACGPYGSFSIEDGDVILSGDVDNAEAGQSLATGDFDGDGQADLWVGAYDADDPSTDAGQAHLHLGPITANADIKGDASATLSASTSYAYLSYRMAVGDLDGDSKDDIVLSSVNSPERSNDYEDGSVYLLNGNITSDATSDTSSNYSWWAYGGYDDYFGWSLAVGDLDNDGQDDLLVGSPTDEANGYLSGSTFLFLGPLSGGADYGSSLDDATWTGDYEDRAGTADAVGDLNGDGVDDWITGAPRDSSSDGVVYVVFGPLTTSGTLSSGADVTLDGASSERAGSALFTADWDGDGTDDLAVGAPRYSSNTGRVYVLNGPVTTSGNLSSLSSSTFSGAASGEYTGSALHGGCDVDGDGMDELLIGAPDNNSGGTAYMMLGGFATGSIALSTDADTTISGDGDDEAGSSVLCLPDQNGDGIDELAVGSPYDGTDAGKVSIFFGGGE
ncbi:MAG: hypothetical protein ACI9VR_001902, partial [Cognaticolwellia sp.]